MVRIQEYKTKVGTISMVLWGLGRTVHRLKTSAEHRLSRISDIAQRRHHETASSSRMMQP